MYRDIAEIRQFYQSLLGRMTAHILRRKINAIWADDMHAEIIVAGVGYALPYLDSGEGKKSFSVMTATQGVVHWPMGVPARTVLTEDHILPFPDGGIDRLLLVHAVENSDYLRELMQEAWRVLSPQGRVLLVVPNRAGLWARLDKTPFGYGRPYSMKQLRALLRDLLFVVERHEYALYFFPSHNRLLLTMANMFERIGARLLPKFAGVTLVEASKQLYNVTPVKVTNAVPVKSAPSWWTETVPTGG